MVMHLVHYFQHHFQAVEAQSKHLILGIRCAFGVENFVKFQQNYVTVENICRGKVYGDIDVWNCPKEHHPAHSSGYDVCISCYVPPNSIKISTRQPPQQQQQQPPAESHIPEVHDGRRGPHSKKIKSPHDDFQRAAPSDSGQLLPSGHHRQKSSMDLSMFGQILKNTSPKIRESIWRKFVKENDERRIPDCLIDDLAVEILQYGLSHMDVCSVSWFAPL